MCEADGKFVVQREESGAAYRRFLAGDRLFAADGRANWIQLPTPDGKRVGRFGEKGTGPGQFRIPQRLCVDSKGAVYAAEVQKC